MEKVKLKVLGISYSQAQSGSYALVLGEEAGERRIPIIIGGYEAQSIAIQLEKLTPPRPLTHDLFVQFAQAYGLSIREVFIYRLESGIFYCRVATAAADTAAVIELDARTSDAVALALRFKCPIYTTSDILDKAGILLPGAPAAAEPASAPVAAPPQSPLRGLSGDDLRARLQTAVQSEDYEQALLINEEISRRKKGE